MSIRKPNELHLLNGTARADRGTDKLVEIDGALADAPRLQDFAKEVDRQKIFKQVRAWVKHLTGQAKIDEIALSLLVDQVVLYGEAKRNVQENGAIIVSQKTGSPYSNPALNNMNTAHDKIVKMMHQFGLTPATRSGLKASQQMEADPMDEIMQGVKK